MGVNLSNTYTFAKREFLLFRAVICFLTLLLLSSCSRSLEINNLSKCRIDSLYIYTAEDTVLIPRIDTNDSKSIRISSQQGTDIFFSYDNGSTRKLDVYVQNAMRGTIELDIESDTSFTVQNNLKIGF